MPSEKRKRTLNPSSYSPLYTSCHETHAPATITHYEQSQTSITTNIQIFSSSSSSFSTSHPSRTITSGFNTQFSYNMTVSSQSFDVNTSSGFVPAAMDFERAGLDFISAAERFERAGLDFVSAAMDFERAGPVVASATEDWRQGAVEFAYQAEAFRVDAEAFASESVSASASAWVSSSDVGGGGGCLGVGKWERVRRGGRRDAKREREEEEVVVTEEREEKRRKIQVD
ncbi:hypothetical protein BO94DRAFT_627212 [Aspergillus sclerotioniger CBS 115572]|uniref:Uncharacterized protein n=1 Tax=Aspergillus sclerotioniger CBS 115572 TaxID=1450535 RepID=A0A317VW47_9EURO|nr:hypothetical protein BO94DRAFT_627212 [Aspergillus sclerotioniger CBS 115572]PWY76150.1 hypothetical protein BO94DRAFT_627212 [Aspergillus sclerotioniger CBS 115572]